MTNITLIKDINDSLKTPAEKDPVLEALQSLADEDMTNLHDDQIEGLVDYMKEMIDSSNKNAGALSPTEAAHMALDDVAGFETAPKRIIAATIQRMLDAYAKKFG